MVDCVAATVTMVEEQVILESRLRVKRVSAEARRLQRLFQASHDCLTWLTTAEQWVGAERLARSTDSYRRAVRRPIRGTRLPIP